MHTNYLLMTKRRNHSAAGRRQMIKYKIQQKKRHKNAKIIKLVRNKNVLECLMLYYISTFKFINQCFRNKKR